MEKLLEIYRELRFESFGKCQRTIETNLLHFKISLKTTPCEQSTADDIVLYGNERFFGYWKWKSTWLNKIWYKFRICYHIFHFGCVVFSHFSWLKFKQQFAPWLDVNRSANLNALANEKIHTFLLMTICFSTYFTMECTHRSG